MKDLYSDRVTMITDPFYVCRCPQGHAYWSVIYVRTCRTCGKRLERCVPADIKKAVNAN